MSLINVSNPTFGYDGAFDNVFENVSFKLILTGGLVLSAETAGERQLFLNF